MTVDAAPGVRRLACRSQRVRQHRPMCINPPRGTKVIKVYLNWDAVSTATYYDVKGSDTGTVTNVGNVTQQLIGSDPYSNTAYVRACNSNGCSAWVGAPPY